MHTFDEPHDGESKIQSCHERNLDQKNGDPKVDQRSGASRRCGTSEVSVTRGAPRFAGASRADHRSGTLGTAERFETSGTRGAPRLRRDVPSRPQIGDPRHGGAARSVRNSRGATASQGVPSRPQIGDPRRRGASRSVRKSRGATAPPGRPEPPGGLGAISGPPVKSIAPSQKRNGSIRQRTRAQYAVQRAPYFSRQRRSSRQARWGKKHVSQSAGR